MHELDERLNMLKTFGLDNFPADTTPAECADLFNNWLRGHFPSFPQQSAKGISPLLLQLGFARIGRKMGRARLFNPHRKVLPL